MPQRVVTPSQHRITRRGWCRSWLFSLLLLSMAVVFGVQATAHQEPASPHFVVAEELAQANTTAPSPHCEHGHGWEQGAEILLRGERLDVDGTATHRPVPAVVTPPVASAIGLPGAAPTFARPPIYLLTQRLRP